MVLTPYIPAKRYSIAEYFDLEAKSEEKHEFHNGKIIQMAGGTANHSLIATNFTIALGIALEDQNYQVLNSDVKIHIPKIRHFVYPDAIVIAEVIEYYENRRDIIVNPLLVIEVLSSSTEDYDKTQKFMKYRFIPSFKEYVLVSQDEYSISTFFRKEENLWQETNINDNTQSIHLQSLNIEIPLQKIYKNVKFYE
jgi:Uma2 family endonuclease